LFSNLSSIGYFNNRGSNVFESSLDASKALDRLNHNILVRKLVECGVPPCLVNVIINWYNKLNVCVHWNGVYSSKFAIFCGVRQGSVLSPLLFNIYVDDLIDKLESKGYGWNIGKYFFSCVMYADDLLLAYCLFLFLACNQYLIFAMLMVKLMTCYLIPGNHEHKSYKYETVWHLDILDIEWVDSFNYLGYFCCWLKVIKL